MMDSAALLDLVGGALYGVWFRSLPFIAYALIARRVPNAGKLVALAAVVALYVICERIHGRSGGEGLVRDVAVSWGYFLLASLLVHGAVPLLRTVGCTSTGVFILSGMLFLGIPGILIHNPATFVTLALGFELMFAAHSYALEQSRSSPRASLGTGLVFLLVNPTLVFPERGIDHGCARWSLPGAGRLLLGAIGLLVSPFASFLASRAGPWVHASTWKWWGAPAVVAVIVLLFQLYAQYLAHSSLASFQIGAMRLLGYDVPERYDYPFLARSPDDFWRRWNKYLGAWLLRYSFLPLSMRFQRRLPRRWWTMGKGLALVGAFGLCGLAHEMAGYALRFSLPMGAAVGFVFYGAVLTLWLGLGQIRKKVEERWARALPVGWRTLHAGIAWSVGWAVFVAFGAVALPALAGFGLRQPVARWVTP